MRPLWREVEISDDVRCRSANPSGPNFLYQDRSISWVAIFWPGWRRFKELDRCIRGLKKPREDEKLK